MLISDRLFALACCGAVLVTAATAQAFEAKDAPEGGAPRSALQALPSPALPVPSLPGSGMPALPTLGIDDGLRKMLRGFRQSYESGNKSAALRQLEDAADKGHIAARWKAARMLADGDGVTRDDFRAFQHFRRIAESHGDESRESPNAGVVANSFVALGLYWRDGIKGSPIRPDNGQALRMFNYAATYYANADGQYQLGMMWLDGSAGAADPLRAARWLNLAAEKGHPVAQAVLGRMLFLGEAMPRQAWRGLMWLQLANENAQGESTGWVRDLHAKAYSAASEEERLMARKHADRFMRAAERR